MSLPQHKGEVYNPFKDFNKDNPPAWWLVMSNAEAKGYEYALPFDFTNPYVFELDLDPINMKSTGIFYTDLPDAPKEKAEMTQPTLQEMQDRLIAYCSEKPSRYVHLKRLAYLLAREDGEGYQYSFEDEVNLYLDDESHDFCEDGKRRAREAIGIEPEEVWVEKLMIVDDVLKNPSEIRIKYPNATSLPLSKLLMQGELLTDYLSKFVPHQMQILVEVKEKK